MLVTLIFVSCGGANDTGDGSAAATTSSVITTSTAVVTTSGTAKITELTTKQSTTLALQTTVYTFPNVTPSGEVRPKDDVVPVIIIPGIMGSQLVDPVGNLLWPTDVSSGGIQNLAKLDLANGTPGLSAVSLAPVSGALVNRSIHIGSNDTYRALATALSEEFGSDNVYFFGYDWRQDLRLSAIELYKFIEQVKYTSNDDKVNVVSHSMGGLVLTSYLALCDQQGKTSSIDTAVTAGTPFYGSEKASAVIGGYGDFLKDYVDVDGIASTPAGSVMLGTISDLITSLAKGFPSVYTMIPKASYNKFDTGLGTAAGVNGRVTADWLNSNYASAYKKVNHFNVVGGGYDTLEVISESGAKTNVNGDGTVTHLSAVGAFDSSSKTFNGRDHGKLVASADTLAYIVNCLK